MGEFNFIGRVANARWGERGHFRFLRGVFALGGPSFLGLGRLYLFGGGIRRALPPPPSHLFQPTKPRVYPLPFKHTHTGMSGWGRLGPD